LPAMMYSKTDYKGIDWTKSEEKIVKCPGQNGPPVFHEGQKGKYLGV
jgi:hypothetical protein